MIQKCGACGSRDCTALADTFQCLICGALTNYEGEVVREGAGPGLTTTKTWGGTK